VSMRAHKCSEICEMSQIFTKSFQSNAALNYIRLILLVHTSCLLKS